MHITFIREPRELREAHLRNTPFQERHDRMESYTFTFQERDSCGCTCIDKGAFKDDLELTHLRALVIERVDGSHHKIDVIKCISKGTTFYQINLSDFGILKGAVVTFWPRKDARNTVLMTVVQPSQLMWKHGGVVDAIVDLQRRLENIEDCVYG